jgi:hypothetical protein
MKTDNHNLPAKLALRRRMLADYHPAGGLSVCDCFSGGEVLWQTLRAEFHPREYLALDLKSKRARLKLDSLRYLQNQQWTHNVLDLDAYGSPWRHWFEILRRGLPCLVFLTIGNTMFRQQQTEALAALGITFTIPGGLHAPVSALCADHSLGKALTTFTIRSALEALNPGGNARYLGLKLDIKPKQKRATRCQPT